MTAATDRYRRISELKTLCDDLKAIQLKLFGAANALGFKMGAWEHRRSAISSFEWVRSFANPVSLGFKAMGSLLEKLRIEKASSPQMKRLVLSLEAHLFASHLVHDVVQGFASPVYCAAKVGLSLMLKGMTIFSLHKEEQLKQAMDLYWQTGKELEASCSAALGELNKEIDKLS